MQFQQVTEAYHLLSNNMNLNSDSIVDKNVEYDKDDNYFSTTAVHSKGRLDWGGYWWMMDFYNNSIEQDCHQHAEEEETKTHIEQGKDEE